MQVVTLTAINDTLLMVFAVYVFYNTLFADSAIIAFDP